MGASGGFRIRPVPRVHLHGAKPGQAGSEGSPGRGWKDLVHLCSAKAAEAGTTSETSTGFRANNSTGSLCFHPLAHWLLTMPTR